MADTYRLISRQEVVGPQVSLDFVAMDIRKALDHQVSYSLSAASAAASFSSAFSLPFAPSPQMDVGMHVLRQSERRRERGGWDASLLPAMM